MKFFILYADSGNDGNLMLFLGFLVFATLVAFTIWAARLQKQEKLVIFSDYSDATFTILTPIAPLAVKFLLNSIGLPSFIGTFFCVVSAVAMVSVVVIRSAHFNNGFTNVYFYISLVAKVLSAFVVLGLCALVLASAFGGPEKDKNESELSWQLRKEKAQEDHAKAVAAGAAMAGAGVVGLIHLFTKNTCFSWDLFFSPVVQLADKIKGEAEIV